MKIVHPSLAALLLSGTSLACAALPQYTVTAIAPAGSYAQDINNAGTVSGYSGAYSGFLYNAGSYSTHTAPGAAVTSFGAINSSGVVLGHASLPSGATNAVRYAGGVFTQYAPPPGYNTIRLSDINDGGTMIGGYSRAGSSYAFVDSGSGPQLLAPAAGGSIAYAINNGGTIAGSASVGGIMHAAVLDTTGYTLVGSFVGGSGVFAINDAGWMGGYYGLSSVPAGAFLRDAMGNMTLYSLPNRQLYLNDINTTGLAVGTGWDNGSPDSYAYLFSGSTALDLNTRLVGASDWTIVAASSINDSGQIAGTGCHQSTGLCQAVLLEVSPVPEPATWAMLLGGLAVAGYGARRRNQRDATSAQCD